MIDYHVHTSLCNHAAGTLEQSVRAAGVKGLATICFPDHPTLQEAGRTDRVCPKYPGMLESMLDYEYFDVVCNPTRSYQRRPVLMLDDSLKSADGRLGLCGMAILILLLAGLSVPVVADDAPGPFDALEKRLIADGFDSARIKAIFASPDVSFEAGGVSAYFMHNESKLNYKQFTRIWNIASARKYMKEHQEALAYAEKTFAVDKEVITAIILVETKLGTYVGNKSVINTLATLSAMTDEKPRQAIWDSLPDDDRRMSRQKFEKKADQKASWAFRELKAFLTYTEKEGMDPTTIKGSYAGAMGISQFMPSNIAPYGKDGNADGQVDLFVHADAISSIASYLKHYGWKPGIARDEAFKVVYHYNHSKYYVNTILDIADKLKG